jgi:CRP-like cAMP-binding protein
MNIHNFFKEHLGITNELLLNELTAISNISVLKNNEELVRQGNHQTDVTLLLEGLLVGYSVDSEGMELVDCFCCKCGDIAIAPHDIQKPSELTIKALADSQILQIPVSCFLEMLEKYEEVVKLYKDKLIEALENKSNIKNVLQRDKGKDLYMWFLNEYPGMIELIPHRYIASFLGMTEVHFSRIHRQFEMER